MKGGYVSVLASVTMWLLSFNSQANPQSYPLMPYPQSAIALEGAFSLQKPLNVWTKNLSAERRAWALKLFQSKALSSVGFVEDQFNANIRISAQQSSDGIPDLNEDESYSLKITSDAIELKANTERGVLHGLQTIRQLSYKKTAIASIEIKDSPRYPWRGLLIDSVRHFMPVETIKRQLQGMASAKLNTFHWHLTDDQGWRFQSDHYPKLHLQASDGLYYSKDQIKDVVSYAHRLGIRVVPEFDVPGHASAIAVAYPELITLPGPYQHERNWGVFEPLLDPTKPGVYEFIDSIVAELSQLFPDPYLHIGGDEVDPHQWQQSVTVQKFMAANNIADSHQLQRYFNEQVQQILKRHNKRMVGWDEIYDNKLNKDIVIQSWRGQDSLAKLAEDGFHGLLSTGYYIDQPQYTHYHYRNDPLPASIELNLDDQDVVQWQHWSMEMPRRKGSAISAEFVTYRTKGNETKGLISINGQPVKTLHNVVSNNDEISFWTDTWMGPMQVEWLKGAGQTLQRVLIGNTPYPLQLRLQNSDKLSIAMQQIKGKHQYNPLTLSGAQNIIGGEATIWSELVQADNLDLRIWPRLYAIAERLWSSQQLQDTADMYHRLTVMEDFAESVGLQHHRQQISGWRSMGVKEGEIWAMQAFAEMVEQAQYYTRHHIKFQQQQYHQLAPLDNLADYLPAHSLALIALNQQIDQLLEGDNSAGLLIKEQFKAWQQAIIPLKALSERNEKLAPLSSLLPAIQRTLNIGITLSETDKVSRQRCHEYRLLLWQAAEEQHEMVIGLAHSVEKLLRSCSGNR